MSISLEELTADLSAAAAYIAKLDGESAQTSAELFRQLSTAFHFPEYFGANWDALDECLADLSWAQADMYVVLVSHAGLLLRKEPASERKLLGQLLCDIAAEWKQPSGTGATWYHGPKAFHTVFIGSRIDLSELIDDLQDAGCELDLPRE